MKRPLVNRRTTRISATLCVAALALTGCSLLDGPKPDVAPRETPKHASHDAEVKFVPDGSAKDNLPYFQKTLEKFSKTKSSVSGKPIAQALEDAGFTRENMQLSQDKTPDQNPAESLFVSVRFHDQCLMGQITADDRKVFTDVLPAIGPSDDQCLVVPPDSGS